MWLKWESPKFKPQYFQRKKREERRNWGRYSCVHVERKREEEGFIIKN